MNRNYNNYHKEFNSTLNLIKSEEYDIGKRRIIIRGLLLIYFSLSLTSLFIFNLWIGITLTLIGFILLPFFFINRNRIIKSPFLILNTKYIQVSEKTFSWTSIKKIEIARIPLKNYPNNYRITICFHTNKLIEINTYYFESEELIIESMLELSEIKKIQFAYFTKQKNR